MEINEMLTFFLKCLVPIDGQSVVRVFIYNK